jgi:hypothetical protein
MSIASPFRAGTCSPPPPQQGLLLGVTNLDERRLAADCRRLVELAR